MKRFALPSDSTSYAIAGSSSPDATASGKATDGKLALPTRFVALLFDDSHLDVGDLGRAKIAALKFIDTSVKPSERLAIFNISGRSQVDFTDDHEKIRAAIKTLIPNPVGAYDPKNEHDCLQITYYQADLIQNKNDQQAARGRECRCAGVFCRSAERANASRRGGIAGGQHGTDGAASGRRQHAICGAAVGGSGAARRGAAGAAQHCADFAGISDVHLRI